MGAALYAVFAGAVMSKFVVGEIAIIVHVHDVFKPKLHNNMECTIASDLFKNENGEPCHLVDIGLNPADFGSAYSQWDCPEYNLKKLPPHSEPSTWDDCVFKPEGVTV